MSADAPNFSDFVTAATGKPFSKMSTGIPVISKLKMGTDILDVDYYLRKEYEDISLAAEEIPGVIAWLGEMRGWCYGRFINSESAWRTAEAKAYFELRGGQFQALGFGEKMTEESLKHAVQLDPIVREAAATYADNKRKLIRVDETIDALKLKIDLVRSSETTRRSVVVK